MSNSLFDILHVQMLGLGFEDAAQEQVCDAYESGRHSQGFLPRTGAVRMVGKRQVKGHGNNAINRSGLPRSRDFAGCTCYLTWISQTWLAFRWLSDVLTARFSLLVMFDRGIALGLTSCARPASLVAVLFALCVCVTSRVMARRIDARHFGVVTPSGGAERTL
jgi:hypothetical protein